MKNHYKGCYDQIFNLISEEEPTDDFIGFLMD